ncbi:hypothetical protein FHT77_003940 [Rhizobium sp. BK181]|nr:hypothetical protein [Rhizobium sp. BK181]MBB3318044.1 hypothetical protein [Rhizobium sp. BK181]
MTARMIAARHLMQDGSVGRRKSINERDLQSSLDLPNALSFPFNAHAG